MRYRVLSRRDRAAPGAEGGGARLPRREPGQGLGARLRRPGGAPRAGCARWSSRTNGRPGMQAFAFNTRRADLRRPAGARGAGLGVRLRVDQPGTVLRPIPRGRRASSTTRRWRSRGLPEGEELAVLEKYRGKSAGGGLHQPLSGAGHRRLRLAARQSSEGARAAPPGRLGGARHAAGERGDGRADALRDPDRLADLRADHAAVRAQPQALGIEASIRLVDQSQYVNRLRSFDFDMAMLVWGQSDSPGNEQRDFWSSAAAKSPGSSNYLGRFRSGGR